MSTNNRRAYRNEHFWRRMIRQWRDSGLSVRAFCQRHDLGEQSFYTWRRTLAQRDADPMPPPFVPVRITSEAPHAAAHDRGAAAPAADSLEIVLSTGRRLRVAPGFDGPTLQRLLTLLEEGRP
jgi:transposase-like protein